MTVPVSVLRYPVRIAVASTVLCGVLMVAGYLFKARCFGPVYDGNGVSGPDLFRRWTGGVCYTDLQSLWSGRQLFDHAAPYSGSYSAATGLTGGTLEYPVLSGVLLWLAALPATTDAQFVTWSAGFLGICGLLVAFLLGRLVGRRSLWWSLAPALVLYTVLNNDLFAVAATVGAIALVVASNDGRRRRRLLVAAVLLAVGGALKLYPLMFVLPVGLWIWLGARGRTDDAVPGADAPDRALAVMFVSVAGVVFVAVNLPFVIANFEGWWAAYQFQWQRPIDNTTNSIWYWGLRPYSESSSGHAQRLLALASTLSTAAALLGVALVGLWRRRQLGSYPWLQVSAAMLCAYMLFNKVHSPQYVLWLIPFLVLIRVPSPWIVGYFVADVLLGVGFLRRIASGSSSIEDSIWPQIVVLGVWGRAVLLGLLIVVFLRSGTALRVAGVADAARRSELAVPSAPVSR